MTEREVEGDTLVLIDYEVDACVARALPSDMLEFARLDVYVVSGGRVMVDVIDEIDCHVRRFAESASDVTDETALRVYSALLITVFDMIDDVAGGAGVELEFDGH